MALPPVPVGGILTGLPTEPTEATRFYRVVNAVWPDLLNQKSLISPVRNGVNRETGMLLQGWEHVEQSMKVIFATPFHERILRQWVGSMVPHLLGEIAVSRVITRFHWAMAVAIDLWEPNYRIQTVFFMGDALESWKPQTFDVIGEFRLGHAFFRTEGSYRPRAHLGDTTPYQQKAIGLISRGGDPIWDPALGSVGTVR
jgi:phage baseplate assembly protein W